MEILMRLVETLPRLKTPLQLSGLVVIVAAIVMTQAVQAENTLAHISLGAIGVLLIVFGQLFPFMSTSIPKGRREHLLIRMFAVFCVFILALIALTGYFFAQTPTRIVLMDSFARVYPNDESGQFRLTGSTLSSILNDLPVVIDQEPTYSDWVTDRCEQIRKENPELVIIHQSAFCPESETTANCHESESELHDFFACMKDTNSRFLMYTRYAYGSTVIAGVISQMPEMSGRITAFPMIRKGTTGAYQIHDFTEPAIQRELKQVVRDILQNDA